MEQPTSDPKLSCQLRDQAGNIYKLFDKLRCKQILEASKGKIGNSMLMTVQAVSTFGLDAKLEMQLPDPKVETSLTGW